MAGDAKYPSVGLLLHGDGADGGTTITDNSPSPKSPTTANSVTTSTTTSKYGGSALRFANVSTSRLVYAHDSAFQPSGDFCVEAWCCVPTVTGSPRVLVWKGTSSGVRPYSIYIESDGTVRGQSTAADGGIAVDIRSFTKVVANTLVHVCYERTGDTFRLYMDGVVVATQTYSGALYSNTSDPLAIGNVSSSTYPLSGDGVAYIDDLRITLESRYAGAFTPTGPHPDSADSSINGVAATTISVTSTAAGVAAVAGAAAAAVSIASTGAGSARVAGAATASIEVASAAAGAIKVIGTGSAPVSVSSIAVATTGAAPAVLSGSAEVSVASAAAGAVAVVGAASAPVAVASSSDGVVRSGAEVSGSALVEVVSTAAAAVLARGQGAAVVGVASASTAHALAAGAAVAAVEVSSGATGATVVSGTGDAAIAVFASAQGAVALTGQASTAIMVTSKMFVRSGIRDFTRDVSVTTMLREISARTASGQVVVTTRQRGASVLA